MNSGRDGTRAILALAGAGLGLLAGWALVRRVRAANLAGEVALITGGSRGLGLLLARELAREGCRLSICGRNAESLEEARRDLESRGAEVFTYACDVSNQTDVERLVAAVTANYGRIDILVNNAGIIEVGPLETMTVEDFERAIGVMFWGVVLPTLAVLPQMRDRGSGRIVNVTSIGGKVSVPHLLPYSCAKFAAVGFSEGLRAEMFGTGIRVTTVVPGLMRTGGYQGAQFRGDREREFGWFSLLASLPGASISAERAAREIVGAVKQGRAETILSLPATLAAGFHGLFPGLSSDLAGLMNHLVLPKAPPDGDSRAQESGSNLQAQQDSRLLDTLTALGRRAADELQPGRPTA